MTQTTSQQVQTVAAINRVLMGDSRRNADPAEAVKLFRQAAEAGDGGAAARLAVLAAFGAGHPKDFGKAFDYLAKAAELGDKPAQGQLVALADVEDRGGRAKGEWRRIREEIDVAKLLEPPQPKVIFEQPNIAVYEGFASAAVCKWIIARGQGSFRPSAVGDYETGEYRPDPVRTATFTAFNLLTTDLVVAVQQEKLKRLTWLELQQHEPPNLLSYEPGQEYKAHFDFIAGPGPAIEQEVKTLGQRVGTCLTWLNDDYEGGETSFPKLDWKHRGQTGDALIFHNVNREGAPDGKTLHAGLPVTSGRKYLLSQWLRSKPLPLFHIRD